MRQAESCCEWMWTGCECVRGDVLHDAVESLSEDVLRGAAHHELLLRERASEGGQGGRLCGPVLQRCVDELLHLARLSALALRLALLPHGRSRLLELALLVLCHPPLLPLLHPVVRRLVHEAVRPVLADPVHGPLQLVDAVLRLPLLLRAVAHAFEVEVAAVLRCALLVQVRVGVEVVGLGGGGAAAAVVRGVLGARVDVVEAALQDDEVLQRHLVRGLQLGEGGVAAALRVGMQLLGHLGGRGKEEGRGKEGGRGEWCGGGEDGGCENVEHSVGM